MFFRILRNELRRKRTMNIILFLFIAMATMFLASSVSNLITVTGAVDYFMEISKVPDYVTLALANGDGDEIAEYLKGCETISEYEIIDTFNIANERISIVEGANTEDSKYQRTASMSIQAVSDDFMKVFDQDGHPIQLKAGEIAFAKVEAEANSLQIGDKVSIRVGEVTQEFTIAAITKDVVFGTEFMGFKRLLICKEDFERFTNQDNLIYTKLYCVKYENRKQFLSDWQKQNFNIISSLEKDLISTSYIMDMLIAGILIIVSICLILIAFMVLRFTIVFTLQEDFREIGIMKAIGLKDSGIKSVYLIKYFGISILAASVGVILSFPFGKLLLTHSVENLVVSEVAQNIFLHILCAIVVVGVVLWFSNSSANSLKNYSAIDAIRNGSNGERYQAKSRLRLWKRGWMKPGFYMALNDILSNSKRFMMLIITFCLGTLLILVPLSAVHTLTGEKITTLFGMASSDVYINNGKGDDYVAEKSIDSVRKDLEEMEKVLREQGMEAQTGVDVGYMIPCYSNNEEELVSYYTEQEVGSWERSYVVLEGREPVAEDELMITDLTAQEMEVSIGDTITYVYADRTQEFIITGTYQTMMNMGKGFRVSRMAKMDENYFSGVPCIQVEIADMSSKEACERIKEIFPDYKVIQTLDYVNEMNGGVADTVQLLTNLIIMMVLIINSLMTALMMKAMMTKERGDIAMLKSIGFSDKSIRAWQIERILLILVFAIVLGTVLSKVIAPVTIGRIFVLMGANKIQLEVRPLETYVCYPLLLLVVAGVTAFLCSLEVKKVDAKEVNNME